MNKLNKLFAGFAAVAMLAACSNDEPTPAPVPENPADGEVAYMTITLTAPESGSRYTEEGKYEESDKVALEHEVKAVSFLFFQKDGSYAFTAKADDTTFVPADGDATNAGNGNVEYIGEKNVLILNGVTTKNYPEYVVTVLNAPADFEPGQTLQETADKLATYATDFSKDRKAPFVMTTSSFFGDKNGANGAARHDSKYFATKLNASDFKTTVADAQANKQPVEIYVERLAAKVELGLAGTTTEVGGKNYYKINQTLAGGNNNTENNDNISDVELYVEVLGWRLNATAKQSYMSKKLQDKWNTGLWSDWNKADDWRSFWAEAWTYGENPGEKLLYETAKDLEGGLLKFTAQNEGNIQYCYENTNEPNYIFGEVEGASLTLDSKKVAVNNAKVTHVVLRTRILQKTKDEADNDVMVAPELVQYRGVLFTGASYKAMLLNQLKADNKLNFWRYVGGQTDPSTDIETKNWASISDEDLDMLRDEAAGHKLGQIKIVAKALNADDKIYERVETAAVGKPGDEGYVPAKVEYKDITATYKSTLDGYLAALNTDYTAVGTDNGDAYYYIPVEHLAATPSEKNAVEGYYGVVRNHWYKLTVNSFKKVGHLVFDPETDETQIIPDGPEDPLYYVGAKVNILSWKVVNQTVNDL